MGIENIELTNLSEEQQERQKKFAELLDIMTSFDTLSDSNLAYEIGTSINDFKNQFEKEGLKLKDYLLGGVLLSGEENLDEEKYTFYDTEDGKIEKFIRSLKEQQ